MRKPYLGFLVLFSFSTFTTAGIDIITTVEEMCIGRDFEKAGELAVSITDDDFADASPDTPLYLTWTLAKNTTLAETLVDTASEQGNHTPINLAARRVSTTDEPPRLSMRQDAVQIVRWRRGEHRIWLRINQSSTEWLSHNGETSAPSLDHQVFFEIGIDPATSLERNQNQNANADANRFTSGQTACTLLFVNLTATSLQTEGQLSETGLAADPSLFDETTQGVTTALDPSEIQWGNPLGVWFGIDYYVGRGILCETLAFEESVLSGPLPESNGTGTLILASPGAVDGPITVTWFDANAATLGSLELAPLRPRGSVAHPMFNWPNLQEAASLQVVARGELLATIIMDDGRQWSLQSLDPRPPSRIVRPKPVMRR
ncbi:hypothetical protein [Acanthopleuribacter pedis]|uniref:Uncharacterized protein n=1 Tax=Acanthopleuribacter pedis TaxID=442870 RepID=A0A8J7Q4T6_9BACT|nr:hypothetical protein [Acanthopleuribacter pedis]MBO1318102.1 hypothetical protein [Acanthopleuribacter pedis]